MNNNATLSLLTAHTTASSYPLSQGMSSRFKCRENSSKRKIGERIDRISSLPEEVIVQILSLLPTKHAVGTSILARKWRYLFTKITNFNFDESLMFDPKFSLEDLENARIHNTSLNQQYLHGFKYFVDRVTKVHNSSTINKFRLKCGIGFDCSNVNVCIQTALLRGVEDLDISTHDHDSRILPGSIFTSENLVVLKLRGNFVMKFPSCVRLPKLKSLHLKSITFSDVCSMSSFISGCPILEELVIKGGWREINEINISSTSLKSLALDFTDWFSDPPFCRINVTFDLPNLLRFNYADGLARNYVLNNFNTLEEASIAVWEDHDREEYRPLCHSVLGLINGVSNAKHLYVSGNCLSALFDGEYELQVFCNLTQLELGCAYYVHWNDVLCKFLNSSPMLENLTFPEGLFDRPCFDDDWPDKNFWSKEQRSPVCFSSHLKVVIIESFAGSPEELRIAKYFLKHGKVLKQLILGWYMHSTRDCHNFMELKNAPKANMSCSIELRCP